MMRARTADLACSVAMLCLADGCGTRDGKPTADDTAPAPALQRKLDRAEARIDALEQRIAALETNLRVELPPSSPRAQVVGRRVSIEVTESEVLVEGEAVAMVALRAHLEIILASRPDVSVVLRADPNVELPRVTGVMDVVKEAGISRISVAVYSDE